MIQMKLSVGWSVDCRHAEFEDHYTHRPPAAPLAHVLAIKFVG